LGAATIGGLGFGLNSPPVQPSAAAARSSAGACAVAGINPAAETRLAAWSEPSSGTCKPVLRNGVYLPDAKCTPGAVNPTLTLDVLSNTSFRTGCVRDLATSPTVKDKTYAWYGIPKPPGNVGKNQVCEKDHLVSLELGGADTLANIWPQCGPSEAELNARFFKRKDLVENYLAEQVREGKIALPDAQHGIAADWTQYEPAANQWYQSGGGVRNDDQG
jgi:hypothetical protein